MARAKTAKSGSQTVKASQERMIERGGARFPSMMLNPEEAELWGGLVAAYGGEGHGGAKKTLVAALNALASRKTLSNAELVAEIAKRLEARQ